MKFFITLFIFFLFENVYSATPCPNIDGLKHSSSLEKTITSCEVQKALAQNEIVQKEHKNLIHDKLAQRLAKQVKQTSEELSVLVKFYSNNQQDLTMGNPKVKDKCRLAPLKKFEACTGNKEKIDLLKKYIGDSTEKNESLHDIIANKFKSNLGYSSQKSKLQCPIDESTNFLLQSQLDNISSNTIAERIISNQVMEVELFDNYAQLKLIKDTADPIFINKFKKYLKDNPEGYSTKQRIKDFFKDTQNHGPLSEAVANQCDRMNTSLETFLCKDLNELGSTDPKISPKLFNNLNPNEPLDDQWEIDIKEPGILTAYGLQCLAKEKEKAKTKQKKKNEETVDGWFSKFTLNTRDDHKSAAHGKNNIRQFCDLYECKTSRKNEIKSCLSGGPITAEDLSKINGCDKTPLSNECNPTILKAIDFLKNIEQENQLSEMRKNTITSNSPEKDSSIMRLPSFVETYLGAEATLKTLGRPVTIEAIAKKKEEIDDRKPAVVHSPVILPASINGKSTDVAQSNAQAIISQDTQPEYNPTAASRQAQAAIATKPVATTPKTQQSESLSPTSAASAESTRLREQMEQMLSDMQKNAPTEDGEQQNFAAPNSPAANNGQQASLANVTSSRSLSAEERRLERRADALDEKERGLNAYKRKLEEQYEDRNMPNESDRLAPQPGAKAANSSANDSSRDTASSGSSTGGSANSAPTLTAANLKGEQKVNTAAIIQSEKMTSSISVDELTKLSPDNLKTLGIDATKPFTLKINFKEKTYEVPVKSFVHKGATILGPVIDPNNKDLKEFLMKSPLFQSFIEYRKEVGSI